MDDGRVEASKQEKVAIYQYFKDKTPKDIRDRIRKEGPSFILDVEGEFLSPILKALGIKGVPEKSLVQIRDYITSAFVGFSDLVEKMTRKQIEKDLDKKRYKEGQLINQYFLVRKGDEVGITLEMTIPNKKDLDCVFEAEKQLNNLGVYFATGFHLELNRRDWEFNGTELNGSCKVVFRGPCVE